ncbi:unnamed protein product [Acanthoscelides obtectus]|uniref:MADF domain-containing protein n=1 Tax=Acanthoscelides obtectus TaxID=200917 RepID=A0A9P0KR68_ACAOB|nr:unnamed protein product [Acanthoscelides obtectus]CAK1647706.1 hypothetical protein AOBTE_LOCUS15355 [Acanthoscelides obtectus]
MEIDNEKLISAVREKPPLWNMKDKRYHSRDVQRKLWSKVADEVGVTNNVNEVKKKWEGLRDVFRREYKKVHKSGDEAPEEGSSSWTFFDQMLFLSDIIEPRQLKGNVASPERTFSRNNDGDDIADEDDLPDMESPQAVVTDKGELNMSSSEASKMEPPVPARNHQTRRKQHDTQPGNADVRPAGPPITPRTSNPKRKRNTPADITVDDKFLEIERAKLQLFTEHANKEGHSDYQFLVSLLPYLKKVPEHRKLHARNKLQQVLIDEGEQYHRSPHTHRPTQQHRYPRLAPAKPVDPHGRFKRRTHLQTRLIQSTLSFDDDSCELSRIESPAVNDASRSVS